MVILWHPTFERFVEALEIADRTGGERAGPREALLVLPPPPDLALISRVNDRLAGHQVRLFLLLRSDALATVDYGLWRRLQGKRWTLAIADSTDRLLDLDGPAARHAGEGPSPTALASVIEVVQKFRIDVDFLLTLPSEHGEPADAVRLLERLSSLRVRRVSFAFPFLLGCLGLQSKTTKSPARFFAAFLDAWLASNRPLQIEDVDRLSSRLMAALSMAPNSMAPNQGGPIPLHRPSHSALHYFDAEHHYRDADGPIPMLPPAASESRERCSRSCEYFPVCGGDLYGAKYWFNGRLDSAINPYCAVIAQPFFVRVLEQG